MKKILIVNANYYEEVSSGLLKIQLHISKTPAIVIMAGVYCSGQ